MGHGPLNQSSNQGFIQGFGGAPGAGRPDFSVAIDYCALAAEAVQYFGAQNDVGLEYPAQPPTLLQGEAHALGGGVGGGEAWQVDWSYNPRGSGLGPETGTATAPRHAGRGRSLGRGSAESLRGAPALRGKLKGKKAKQKKLVSKK